MIHRRSLSRAEAEHAMRHGEFDDSVTDAAARVAVVLTQDWCGQWIAMDRYLEELAAWSGDPPGAPDRGLAIFQLIYNTVEYFHAFMSFKETVWCNALIPYVRYYRGGRLVGQSNYVSRSQFLDLLGP
jgi:hypothetical protein